MHTITDIQRLRAQIHAWRADNKTIAFVPTMGNLHAGHLSLVECAQQYADHVIVSIFVNPLQFGANEDLDKYPRTLQADQQQLMEAGVAALFCPTADIMYPGAHPTLVQVPKLTQRYCGASRPGHFDGVATVVCKLFNLVQPDYAIFGSKDYQQLQIIRKMAQDLCFNIEIIAAPTIRAEDGLALSSRNQYLTPAERALAPIIYQTLQQCSDKLHLCNTSIHSIEREAIEHIEQAGLQVDYLHIVHSDTLESASAADHRVTILVAAYLGQTRLIDNLSVVLQGEAE